MVKKYFAGANTAAGYTNLMENNLNDIEKIYGLSGASKKEKTRIMSEILKVAEEKYKDIECVISPFDITDIDAVIIRDTKTATVDSDVCDMEKEMKIIALSDKIDANIQELRDKEKWAFGELYEAYQKGKEIHDEWEKIYIQNMDYKRLEAYEEGILFDLLNGKGSKMGTQNRHRFFGASIPDGSVNYIDNLTEKMEERYFIKGRPGTGKSTFLKKLAKRANEKGFDTEIYYCSFDKASLDMVIVPELSFCVFDSTAPHEMNPCTKRDKILDFYEESGLSGIDEKYEKELSDVAERYRQKMAEGMAYLRLGKLYMKEKEYYLAKNRKDKDFLKKTNKIVSDILGT